MVNYYVFVEKSPDKTGERSKGGGALPDARLLDEGPNKIPDLTSLDPSARECRCPTSSFRALDARHAGAVSGWRGGGRSIYLPTYLGRWACPRRDVRTLACEALEKVVYTYVV